MLDNFLIKENYTSGNKNVSAGECREYTAHACNEAILRKISIKMTLILKIWK